MNKKAAENEAQDMDAAQIKIVNDFSMVVATVNGSGSQTSNLALIRALFRMGIPVSGKNMFPSNIQGMPTHFTVRANKDGFTARREKMEILIGMNPETFDEDLNDLVEGGVCYYPDQFKIPKTRDDVVFYPMPVRQIIKEQNPPSELQNYMRNMVYVGVVSEMLGIEIGEIRKALDSHFKGREKSVELNMQIVEASAIWARENLVKEDKYVVERDNQTEGMIMLDGNTAGALGTIFGGISFIAWYPITPGSSLAEALQSNLPRLRKDEHTGKQTYAIIQAEDELAAVGMIIGAGWAGARAMTSTSGPGLALMAEFAGLAYYAEIPIVIWDIQRMGPSTGLPTRTSQGDILFTRFLGHGDTQQIMLIPGNVEECFEFGWKSFDIAERLQAPVFVLSDLDLGMNLWMSKPFDYPDKPMDRGKVLTAEDLEKIEEFARYRDVDGDGIPYRTLPGTDHPKAAYFLRGSGHNEHAHYSERPEDYTANIERLARKYETALEYMPKPVIEETEGAVIGMIAYGSVDPAINEALSRLAAQGTKIDYLRIRAVPFTEEVHDFIRKHDRIYVVEMNTNGQMHMLLRLDVPDQAMKLISLTHNNGLPMSARWVTEAVLELEGGNDGN
ncbi:MAG: 2-oxoacid:acceptor oxidoreductase subunit alpha [Anaerolineales bacterium]|nr:2-oxoacid:acceptor oxidoreductase subunit alpha [Anaerolineales bacterium]